MKHLDISFCILVTLCSTLGEAHVIRFLYDAFLKDPNPGIPDLQYSRTKPEEWKSLPKLLDTYKMYDHYLFCTEGQGRWVLYSQENYAENDTSAKVIIGSTCVSTTKVKSIQAVGSIRDPAMDELFIFEKPYFVSKQTPVNIKNGTYSGKGGSVIWYNPSSAPWLVNDKICLYHSHDALSEGKVCFLYNLAAQTGLKEPFTFKSGCGKGSVKAFEVTTCYYDGVYKFKPPFGQTEMPKLCGGGGGGKGGGDGDDSQMKQIFTNLMEIWKGRVTGFLESDVISPIPPEQQFMVQLVQKIVAIFERQCYMANRLYISILKTIFIQHLKGAWAKEPWLVFSDDYWKHVTIFLDSCYSHIIDIPIQRLPLSCATNPARDGESFYDDNPDGEFDPVLVSSFDTVIQQMGLIFDAVVPQCNAVNEYKTNDWMMMERLLEKAFITPLSQQLENPKGWRRIYRTMFNGFDVAHEMGIISTCVSSAATPDAILDPMILPNIFYRRFIKDAKAAEGNGAKNGTKDAGEKDAAGGGESDGGGKQEKPTEAPPEEEKADEGLPAEDEKGQEDTAVDENAADGDVSAADEESTTPSSERKKRKAKPFKVRMQRDSTD